MDPVAVKMNFSGLIDALNNGQIDIICAGMSATEERRKSIDFSDAYFTGGFGLLVQKGSKYGCPGIAVKGPRWSDTIFVNANGDRFVKEIDKANLGGYSFYDMAYVQPGKKVFCVFDDETAKKYHWDTSYPQCEKDCAFDAPTLAELAEKLGAKNLEATVAKFNKFVDQKKDEDFDRPAPTLKKKIENGPFHAVQVVLFVHNFTGGLRINENAQVYDVNGKLIPGLYAAGETAGGLYVGNGMPRAIMPGRWAGEACAKA